MPAPPVSLQRLIATPPVWRLTTLILLGVAAVALTLRAQYQEQRMRELSAVIHQRGGQITLDWPAWRRAWEWWQGQGVPLGTEVIFRGSSSNSRRTPSRRQPRPELGDLRGLDIACLYVLKGALTGDEVARLVRAHPIALLRLYEVTGADGVARDLHASATIRITTFDDSDLTDAGLHELPLERIESLFVNGTKVSPAGLRELDRAEKLWCLVLDGAQFNDESVEIVQRLPKLRILGLFGKDVTDGHLQRLQGLKLEKVCLEGTSATPAGVTALKQALPGSVVEVK